MKIKDWIGPVLTILLPLIAGGLHLEMTVASLATQQKSDSLRIERIERMIDNRTMSASLDQGLE